MADGGMTTPRLIAASHKRGGGDENIADDAPALLAQRWHQHNDQIAVAGRIVDDAKRIARIQALKGEKERILRALLKLPDQLTTRGDLPPVPDPDLVNALHGAADESAKNVVAEELEARFPAAYDLLEALHGRQPVARLRRLLGVKTMSSEGFVRSIVKSPEALADIIENLSIVRCALGAQRFNRIVRAWTGVDRLRLIAVVDVHDTGVNLGGYHLAFPVEHGSSQMPPWIGGEGELRREGLADAGYYVLLSDLSRNTPSKAEARQRLRAQYLNIRDNLVKPNYDALQLIVTHAQGMTRSTAVCILALLAEMVEAYGQVAFSTDADAAHAYYDRIVGELERSWSRLDAHERLPATLRHTISDMVENPAGEPSTVHALRTRTCVSPSAGSLVRRARTSGLRAWTIRRSS